MQTNSNNNSLHQNRTNSTQHATFYKYTMHKTVKQRFSPIKYLRASWSLQNPIHVIQSWALPNSDLETHYSRFDHSTHQLKLFFTSLLHKWWNKFHYVALRSHATREHNLHIPTIFPFSFSTPTLERPLAPFIHHRRINRISSDCSQLFTSFTHTAALSELYKLWISKFDTNSIRRRLALKHALFSAQWPKMRLRRDFHPNKRW